MGDGLYATKKINRGTRIFAESPMISTPFSTRPGSDKDPSTFCNEIEHLSKDKVKELDQLYCNAAHLNSETRARVRQWYRDQGATNTNGEILKGKKLQDAAKTMVKRFAIFLTNRVVMRTADQGGGVVGIFPLFSRINHSCVPNARNYYNPTLRRLTVHACRDIEAGEQIFVSYVNYACRTQQQRAQDLLRRGVVCGCSACVDPAVDVLRRRSFELDQGLAAYAKTQMRTIGNDVSPSLLPHIPKTPAEALKSAQELVEVLEKQGLEGIELCKT